MKDYAFIECPYCGNTVDAPIETYVEARDLRYRDGVAVPVLLVGFLSQEVEHQCKMRQ